MTLCFCLNSIWYPLQKCSIFDVKCEHSGHGDAHADTNTDVTCEHTFVLGPACNDENDARKLFKLVFVETELLRVYSKRASYFSRCSL